MGEELNVAPADVIDALRERIAALTYENALLAAVVARQQREAVERAQPAGPPLPH